MRRLLLAASLAGLAALSLAAASHRGSTATRGTMPVVAPSPSLSTARVAPAATLTRHGRPAARVSVAPRTSEPASDPFASAARVARDPETGELGLAPQYHELSIEELQAMAHREAEGLVTIHNADGSETINHQGRFADYLIVRKGRDGKPVFECIEGETPMRHAIDPNRPLPPAPEER